MKYTDIVDFAISYYKIEFDDESEKIKKRKAMAAKVRRTLSSNADEKEAIEAITQGSMARYFIGYLGDAEQEKFAKLRRNALKQALKTPGTSTPTEKGESDSKTENGSLASIETMLAEQTQALKDTNLLLAAIVSKLYEGQTVDLESYHTDIERLKKQESDCNVDVDAIIAQRLLEERIKNPANYIVKP